MELLHKLRGSAKVSSWELDRCEALAHAASGDYAAAEKVLRDAIRADPKDENRVATLAEYYRVRGEVFLREHKQADATLSLSNALSNIELQLQLVASSSHDTIPAFDVPETLLKKAQIQITLQSYSNGIATLDQVLQQQPRNYTALLNRAEAEIQTKQFKEAKDDYKAMGKVLRQQPWLMEFGLARVAAAETNSVEETDHLKRGLKSAPHGSLDYQQASNLLFTLGHK
jgi:Tfp pilus assembly protein PilF